MSEDNGTRVFCEVAAEDFAVVWRAKETEIGDSVCLAVCDGDAGVMLAVVVKPERARMLAAALLNEADAVEGRTPLVFHPPSPSGRDPFGRGAP